MTLYISPTQATLRAPSAPPWLHSCEYGSQFRKIKVTPPPTHTHTYAKSASGILTKPVYLAGAPTFPGADLGSILKSEGAKSARKPLIYGGGGWGEGGGGAWATPHPPRRRKHSGPSGHGWTTFQLAIGHPQSPLA